MLHAVIMAGGAGTRFWPASRAARPKQLLDLVGGRTMIQATVDRLEGLVPPEQTLVVTNRQLVDAIAEQLPGLPPNAIIGEPCKRDTAPCIGLAASLISRHDPDAIMVVMPADHVILPEQTFREAIRLACRLVEQSPSRLVTFGIRPTYPAETFGYIERAEPLAVPAEAGQTGSPPAYRVRRFREKPASDVARQYLESGNYYWNSGIFVWKAATILSVLQQFEPEMCAHIQAIVEGFESEDFPALFAREFSEIRGKSIDYAVMEHYSDVAVIEAPFQWDDVGSWQSLARMRGEDDQGNTILGRHLGLETHGCIIRGTDKHLVVTLGIRDCIVVHTPDATLVANKHDEESIRKVTQLLREQGWEEYL